MSPQLIRKPPNVLVVCHGNVCRSPLAVAVLQKALGEKYVRGRGLSGKSNRPAAKKVREYAERIGLDLSNHRSVALTDEDLQWAELILFMDGGNLKRLNALGIDAPERLVCLASYLNQARIPDPGFLKRGPELDAILDQVVSAAELAAQHCLNNA